MWPEATTIDPVVAECNRGTELLNAGRLEAAAIAFEAALAAEPGFVEACFNLAFVRHRQDRIDEAVALYRRAVELAPDLVGAQFNLAVLLRGRGEREEAAEGFLRVVAIEPENALARLALAETLRELHRLDEAIEQFQIAAALQPGDAKSQFGLGGALLEAGRNREALAPLDAAIDLRHDFVEAHVNRALALRGLERIEEAQRSAEIACVLAPEHRRAQITHGDILAERGLFERAAICYRRALARAPDDAEAEAKLGVALTALWQIDEAIETLQRACERTPDSAAYLDYFGSALVKADRFDEAMACYRRALEIEPRNVSVWCNLGVLLQNLKCHEDALDCYGQARALAPESDLAKFNESALRLARGEYEEGWRLYESRVAMARFAPPPFERPRWRGEALSGRSILLDAEQGLGDTLQFIRYLPMVADRAESVLLRVPPSVSSLIAAIDPRATVLEPGAAPPDFDLYSPLMSLPHAFGTTLDTIPARIPYLAAPSDRVAHWRRTLGRSKRKRVGLAWSGNKAHLGDRHRSIPLATLTPLLAVNGVDFVSVQKEIRETDRAVYDAAPRLLKHGETLGDFADTAGLVECLDLVVSVDTAVAHLAGALGRPVWLLLAWDAEWRWLDDRDDSPWYPTARLFRQESRGDWDGLIRRVAAALAAEPARKSSH